jgi:RimJ/RimL family protein N-acetyltransferase
MSSKLEGSAVSLRPVTPHDFDFLYRLATDPVSGLAWRNRGDPISPDVFHQLLWQNILAQFTVCSKASGELVGHVAAAEPNLRDGHAYLFASLSPQKARLGWPLEGFALFVSYVFSEWRFEKLYFETPEPAFDKLRSGVGKYFAEEGCLKGHLFRDGRYWDMHVLALYRSQWADIASGLLAAARPSPEDATVDRAAAGRFSRVTFYQS